MIYDEPARAARLDAQDPLAGFRERFVVDDPGVVYFDGNSLGRLPASTATRLAEVVREEWGGGLIRSWARWRDLPRRVGDLLGPLLGTPPGTVAVADSTSVNLYKLAAAALEARPGRSVIVTDDDNFPSDRFVLEGLAQARGGTVRYAAVPLEGGLSGPSGVEAVGRVLDGDVALVSLSHVSYRSGGIADMEALTRLAHDVGALVLWDVCHSVGAVPVDLTGSGADLAVGCTYKYLNAGPGAPAFLYVRPDLQPQLRQPVWGWFGHDDPFLMDAPYRPAPGIERFLVGTPSVLGLCAVEEGARLCVDAGIGAIREKGMALTRYAVELAEELLFPLGFRLASPADPTFRGSHISLGHDRAGQVVAAATERGVLADFRGPALVRIGLSPLSTSFSEVHRGLETLRDVARGL